MAILVINIGEFSFVASDLFTLPKSLYFSHFDVLYNLCILGNIVGRLFPHWITFRSAIWMFLLTAIQSRLKIDPSHSVWEIN